MPNDNDGPPRDPFRHLRLITLKQLRELVPFSPQHIYRLQKTGDFPARVILGDNRSAYRLSDIEAWIANPKAWAKANKAGADMPSSGTGAK